MTHIRLFIVTLILLAIPPAVHLGIGAAERSDTERPAHAPGPAIRTTDRWLRNLLDDGMRSSETFRALVDRLERSDVIVYLECESAESSHLAGRLTFITAAAGRRYVVIRLRPMMSRKHQLSIMAHELRHAVEIADAPAVVDEASLFVEYQRIGHLNRWSSTHAIAFDSDAAIATGREVLRELSGTAAD